MYDACFLTTLVTLTNLVNTDLSAYQPLDKSKAKPNPNGLENVAILVVINLHVRTVR